MAEDAPVSMSAGGRRICSVCCQAVAAYTCPRCHKAYCTSACYKQHGHQCTEAFYREQATSQMKATRADAEQTQQMMHILQRMHEQGGLGQQQQHGGSSSSEDDNEDGSDEDDDAVAAAGLDGWLAQSHEFQQLLQRAAAEGDAFEVLPSDLSAELADRLGALALSGRLSHLLQPWRPWWANPAAANISLSASGQRVVAELTGNRRAGPGLAAGAVTEAVDVSSRTLPTTAGVELTLDSEGCAPLPEPPEQPLPALAKLAGPSFLPSPLLPFELLQLLVAYCAVMHYWNGEPDCGECSSGSGVSEQGWEAAEQLLLLAPPLEQQAARLASSSSSRMQPVQQSAKQQDNGEAGFQQQQQQQQGLAVVADSVRCACMQLADAAGALHSELRVVLQQATADALALLQLGRAAVLLALTDSVRLLERGRRNLKLQRQQQKQQQQQPARLHEKGGTGKHAGSLQQQQQVLLEQQLKLACRKLVFFQVWCNGQAPAEFEQLALQLAVELREQQAINTPAAAAGVRLGVQPVQSMVVPEQQQQQQPLEHQQQTEQLGKHMQQQTPELKLQAVAATLQHAVNAQQQQLEPVLGQVPDKCSQGEALQRQQQQQQQQQRSCDVSAGSSAPFSDLYELD